jgi:hypothetical protein
VTTPKELFAPSITLTNANNPFSGQSSNLLQSFPTGQTPINTHQNQQSFVGQMLNTLNSIQTQTPPNPFHKPPYNTHHRPQGGKFRGRRIGSSQRN